MSGPGGPAGCACEDGRDVNPQEKTCPFSTVKGSSPSSCLGPVRDTRLDLTHLDRHSLLFEKVIADSAEAL